MAASEAVTLVGQARKIVRSMDFGSKILSRLTPGCS
jgi:hypothetical protein